MSQWIFLIPLLPLIGFSVISLAPLYLGKTLPKQQAAWIGCVAVGFSALAVFFISIPFLQLPVEQQVYIVNYWSWFAVGDLALNIGFYFDGLTLVMCSIVTGVGFLIHLYSAAYMNDDASMARFFAYLNLFIAAMLVLVLADNLVLLYLGWEGVGLCSCLLIGFWYHDKDNGYAARKAFVVTRVGDTALLLGLFLLFTDLGTLNIQAMLSSAQSAWASQEMIATVAALLILGGAVGKSAQLPLHTWLPDAMAGPTPVSALIHAATMVTAGVYLIARTHPIFVISEVALQVVMWVGLLSLLLAAFSALVQRDIKRILAYSTMSQIGYMFLALGVGAWSASIFHLMTHAFFKALLFMAAGFVIISLHHKQDIFEMGGLKDRSPLAFWSFLIGGACLCALPFTSGFFSKESILMVVWHQAPFVVWLGAVFVSFLTALYTFRLFFIVFYGEEKTQFENHGSVAITIPLVLLAGLSLVGGYFILPLTGVFPSLDGAGTHALLAEGIAIAMPILGILLAYQLYYRKLGWVDLFGQNKVVNALRDFFFKGWRFDDVYQMLLINPFMWLAEVNRKDAIDKIFDGVIDLMRTLHMQLSDTQNGQLRWYAASMAAGVFLIVAIALIV